MRTHNDKWTMEQLEYGEDLMDNGYTWEEIAKMINEKFGMHRSEVGVKVTLQKEKRKPHVKIPEGKCYWTFKGRPIGKKHWLWKGVWQYD